ncbi:MAG: prephenate dehydrogenase/arogenate dehydrogenase family protein, partial [Thermodesulfovibrionales bacterium]|nr:prephenate dehydrogenase/arogenate dehydrogenase family protein [Thermodesulfovibrionales bacterium]
VGLIGASFALAMKKQGLCGQIIGHGRNPDNLKRAEKIGIIDTFELDPTHACVDADLILFATPVGSFLDITKNIRGSLKKNTIVTDVGSVKGSLVHDMDALMPEGVFFVGGHPIAGGDQSGIDKASAGLFEGAKCILTPSEKTDKKALDTVKALWKSFGSATLLIDPGEHDKIYAAVSHLPHLLAYMMVNTVADIDNSYFRFSGTGFLDTTRIASSHPELWRDICILNKENVIASVEIFRQNLDRAVQYLRAVDPESLEREFRKARTLREGIGQN